MSFETGTPSRELRVPAEMARLNKATEVLAQSISSLADRLGPVLAAPRVEAEKDAVGPEKLRVGNPPLVEQLLDVGQGLARSTQRINDLLARLEV